MRIQLFLTPIVLAGVASVLIVLIAPRPSEAQIQLADRMPATTAESVQVFRDDFDGASLNPDVWQIYTNGGTVSIGSGYLTLSRTDAGNTFPYIHTKFNPIPLSGNFAIKVGIQYLEVTYHGDGLSIDDRLPANGSPGPWAWQPTVYTIWQGSDFGYNLTDYAGSSRYYAPAPHLTYHNIEFRWLDNTDEYYIDGQLVNTVSRSSGVPRPVDIWFGNPVIPASFTAWTSFKLDYIEVDALDSPVPFFDLPISYPGRGNPTIAQFLAAWRRCTTAFFDHKYPGEKGIAGDGLLWIFTGDALPGTRTNCELFKNCYDGHEGYDFDDRACYGNAVYSVANGEVVTSETGWRNDGYGNRVVIRHGNTGYKTLYGHLSQILISSGAVTKDTQIGIIGETGCPGCGTHLHLNVYYNGKLVDPSGWEPMPWFEDPYVEQKGGPKSYRLWIYSSRRSTPVNDSLGTNLVSPSRSTTVSIPSNAYGEDYEITITELAPISLPAQLAGAGHGFVLHARNLSGEAIASLNQDITIQVQFETGDIKGIRSNTLSLYAWDATLSKWIPLPTNITTPSTRSTAGESLVTATASTRNIGYIALLGEPYLVYLPIIVRR